MHKKIIEKLTRRYQKMSIQMIISLSFTAVTVLGMVLMGVAFFVQSSNTAKQLTQQSSQRVLAQVNINLDSYLRSMMRISNAMYYGVIKNIDIDEQPMMREMELFYEENRDTVISLALFDAGGTLLCAVPLSQLKPTAAPQQSDWFEQAINRTENLHFSTPHLQILFDDTDERYRWVVSLSRHVQLTDAGMMRGGVLLVDMSFSGIEQVCRDAQLSNDGYIYLIDQTGELIYHPRQQLIYAGLVQENNLQASSYTDGTHQEKFQDQHRQITVKTVGYTGWKLVGVVPESSMDANIRRIVIFGVPLLLFSIFLMAFLNFRISARISMPILHLEQAVKRLEAGGEFELEEIGSYEIQRLARSIRSMVSTLRHLMDDILQQEKQKRRSELEVLQSQINPHFLYNTLDSVIWMTEAGRYEESIAMVNSLARLFRISLSKGNSIIPLQDELSHAHHYMSIQAIRYKNRFETQIVAEAEVAQLYTLKLIVQPLLENAIYHGMAAMEDEGKICVHAYEMDGDLIIDVQDNGCGMRPEIAATLLDETYPQVRTAGSGIGVRNVHRRIQLTFGKDYGLKIFSEPDEGTTVRVRLPKLDHATAQQETEGTQG